MVGLLEQILKIAESDLTVRKAFSGLFIVLVFVGGLFMFEAYTGTWQLARLEKATTILERLQKIESDGALSDELRESYEKASEQLHRILVEAEVKATDPAVEAVAEDGPGQLAKFIAGGAIWFLFTIPFVFMACKKQKGAWPGLFGMILVGCFFGGINVLIPNIYAPWVNLVLIPFITFMALAGIPVMIPAFAKVRETAQRETIINNLRQLASGADQYFLEEGKTEVEVKTLTGENGYVKPLKPVADEVYPEKISTDMEELTAFFPTGEKVTIPF